MTYELTPGLIDVGGILVENYQRDSLANAAAKEALGLSPDNPVKAGIGIAAVQEFFRLHTDILPIGQTHQFNIGDYATALQLVSLFVDMPKNKSLRVEVYASRGSRKVFDQVFIRTSTPYAFPDLPLGSDCFIKITPVDYEARVHLVLKPCVILDSYVPPTTPSPV